MYKLSANAKPTGGAQRRGIAELGLRCLLMAKFGRLPKAVGDAVAESDRPELSASRASHCQVPSVCSVCLSLSFLSSYKGFTLSKGTIILTLGTYPEKAERSSNLNGCYSVPRKHSAF